MEIRTWLPTWFPIRKTYSVVDIAKGSKWLDALGGDTLFTMGGVFYYTDARLKQELKISERARTSSQIHFTVIHRQFEFTWERVMISDDFSIIYNSSTHEQPWHRELIEEMKAAKIVPSVLESYPNIVDNKDVMIEDVMITIPDLPAWTSSWASVFPSGELPMDLFPKIESVMEAEGTIMTNVGHFRVLVDTRTGYVGILDDDDVTLIDSDGDQSKCDYRMMIDELISTMIAERR
jgi:hypothetical protein